MRICDNGIMRDATAEEIAAMDNARRKHERAMRSQPMTEAEVSRLFIAQNINTVITDDETASRAVEFHPVMKYDGSLIPHGTRINWHGKLKRATVDL